MRKHLAGELSTLLALGSLLAPANALASGAIFTHNHALNRPLFVAKDFKDLGTLENKLAYTITCDDEGVTFYLLGGVHKVTVESLYRLEEMSTFFDSSMYVKTVPVWDGSKAYSTIMVEGDNDVKDLEVWMDYVLDENLPSPE